METVVSKLWDLRCGANVMNAFLSKHKRGRNSVLICNQLKAIVVASNDILVSEDILVETIGL